MAACLWRYQARIVGPVSGRIGIGSVSLLNREGTGKIVHLRRKTGYFG
jgi:hypothetical protein